MWSVSTAVQTRATACGGRRRRRGGLSPRSTPPSRHRCSSCGGRVLAAVRARLHRSHLTQAMQVVCRQCRRDSPPVRVRGVWFEK